MYICWNRGGVEVRMVAWIKGEGLCVVEVRVGKREDGEEEKKRRKTWGGRRSGARYFFFW